MEEIIKKCLPTYEILGKIGQGVYGSVFHVKDNLKERAVKVVPIIIERSLSFRSKKDLDSQISHDFHAVQEYYSKIKGDGVIEIHDFHLVDKTVSKQEARAFLILLMEFCPENLSDHVIDHYPVTPQHAKDLMRELAEVLNRLSSRTNDAFIVKDLKPSNLLINKNDQLLVGDLGGIQRLNSLSTAANAQFTPNWSAPELLINSKAADIPSLLYSYGLVSYFVWFGTLPYDKSDFTERTRLIRDQGLIFSRGDMPYSVQGIIEKCLQFDPQKRPENFEEVLRLLSGDQRLIIDDPILAAGPKIPGAASADANPRPARSETYGDYDPDGTTMPPPVSRLPTADLEIVDEPAPAQRSASGGKMPLERNQIGDTWVEPVTGMVFAWVPSGSFQMGPGDWERDGKKDESPAHTVILEGFWMGKFLVTQAEWKKVVAGSFWKKVGLYNANPSHFKTGLDHPVEQVSWNDAQDFMQKLIALNKGKYHFRLPTEAEWEYAARSCGRHHKYAGGRHLNALAWYSANSGMTSHPVGKKQPNAIGLHDMSGNVYEWCLDVYSETAYADHAKTNPLVSGSSPKRVIRGGSWSNSSHEMRTTYRASMNQDFKGNYIGFRVVMTSIMRKGFNA